MTALPPLLQQLVGRCVWATFAVRPRPKSLGDSMQIYQALQSAVAPHGQIVHYRQDVCPVSKERLEKLQVLLEDSAAIEPRTDLMVDGEQLVTEVSPLEQSLLHLQEGRVQLHSLTRDYEQFKHVHTQP